MEEPFHAEGVRGVLHEPEQPGGDGIVLTHGAGSNMDAPLLVRMARAFADAGYFVLRYDLPFRQRAGGSPHPSAAPLDREGVRRAVAAMRQLASGRVFAGGHSYGGRQTAMAASEDRDLAGGLLLLSYPLHPPERPTSCAPPSSRSCRRGRCSYTAPGTVRLRRRVAGGHRGYSRAHGPSGRGRRGARSQARAGTSRDVITRLAHCCYSEE